MGGANTGQAARNDLAPLGHELLQQAHVTILNCVNLFDAELANLFAPKEFASAGAAWPAGTTARGAARIRARTLGTRG
jgi:hypothetical protein